MAINDDFDPDTAPVVMPVSVQRVTDTGHPTRHMLNWEMGTRSWMQKSIVDMNRRFSEVSDSFGDAFAAVQEETFARITADEAIAGQITTITAQVADNQAQIIQEALARASADEAIASTVTSLTATVAGVEASVVTEATARATADDALAAQITTLDASVGGVAANLATEISARATADGALASQITALEATLQDGIDTVAASVATETSARVSADAALATDITDLQASLSTDIDTVAASVVTEAAARASGDGALASQITTLDSTLTTSIGTVAANLSSEAATRAADDGALSIRAANLEVEVIGARNGQTSLGARVNQVDLARANGDSALASSLSTVSTTVGGHTASISSLTSSVNGVAIKYGIGGYVGGSYGGFVFTGALRNDGAANFLLEIQSNMVINGDVTINGSLTTPKYAGNSVSQIAFASGGGVYTGVGITLRGGLTGVLIIATFRGLPGTYFPLGTAANSVYVQRDGATIHSVNTSYEASGSGGSAGISFLQTSVLCADYPGAGYHEYYVFSGNAGGAGGVSIAVLEMAR